MSQAEIYTQLTPVFHEVFGDRQIVLRPQVSAADIDSWDSFNHINLVIALETAFNIRFSSADLAKMTTVGDMVSLIEQKVTVQV